MSQQMHFDEEERSYQASYMPTIEENSGGYRQIYTTAPGQKLDTIYRAGGKAASAGQRLALAIVSVVMLTGGLAMSTSGDASNFMLMAVKLTGLLFVCVTITIINVVFNWRR